MFDYSFFFICACAIFLFPINDAARILAYFPIPSISHQVVFRPITQELAKRGHDVTVITTDAAFTKETRPKNLTEIDQHVSYDLWREKFVALSSQNQDLFAQIDAAMSITCDVVKQQLNTTEVKEIMKKDRAHYDLIIVEAVVRPALILSHIFDAPVVQMSSFGVIHGNYEIMGAPSHPFFSPTVMRQKLVDLTTWEKLLEIYNHFRGVKLLNSKKEEENKLLKKVFGPSTPTVDELLSNVEMLFLNIHPIWGGNAAVPPSIIHMGGLPQKPVKELPRDLKSFLDSSSNGVIYLSFGTNIDPALLPPEKIQMFVSVLSKLPYNILWKWNNDELPSKSDNIKFGKWFPQSDLLRHKNVKLFITQGGLQSTDEALTAGVPLLGVPMLGDQWYNVDKYVEQKIGVRVDLDSISEEKIRQAVTTVIEDESFRRNAERLGTLMRDEPQKSLDRTVWWIEYVIRHRGAKHLRSPAANISWAEYLELELVGIVLGGLVIVLSSIVALFFLVLNYVKNNIYLNKKMKSS